MITKENISKRILDQIKNYIVFNMQAQYNNFMHYPLTFQCL